MLGNPCINLLNPEIPMCQNGGTCVSLSMTSYQCECAESYQGINCEVATSKGSWGFVLTGLLLAIIFGGSGYLMYASAENRKKAELAKLSQKNKMKAKIVGMSGKSGKSPEKAKRPQNNNNQKGQKNGSSNKARNRDQNRDNKASNKNTGQKPKSGGGSPQKGKRPGNKPNNQKSKGDRNQSRERKKTK